MILDVKRYFNLLWYCGFVLGVTLRMVHVQRGLIQRHKVNKLALWRWFMKHLPS